MKRSFLKILRYSQENSLGFLLIKLQAFRPATLKKEIPTQVLPVDIAKFLRLPILKNISERLLTDYSNDSLHIGLMV